MMAVVVAMIVVDKSSHKKFYHDDRYVPEKGKKTYDFDHHDASSDGND